MFFEEKSKTYVSHENLYQLFWLRNIAIAAQSGAIAAAIFYFRMELPLIPILAAVVTLSLFNVYTRFRINNPRDITATELLIQLIVDVSILTVLLAMSGGATNPFAILYLLPLAIAAVMLPGRMTWSLVGVAILMYSLLMEFYVPLPMAHNHGNEFSLHVFGMWLGFVLSAVVIAYFIVSMRNIIRRQSESLNKAQEEVLRNEHLVKLGVLAASTAHDMGTPLNSMTLLLEDIEYDEGESQPGIFDKTRQLRDQIWRCREALNTLTTSAGSLNLVGGRELLLTEYTDSLLDEWNSAHPATVIEFKASENADSPLIMADKVLNHALTNIIDNAVEASPEKIEITSHWDQSYWYLIIRDHGPGLTREAKENIGQMSYSTKPNGLGLGLFLTHAVIKRLGGLVDLYNHEQGGLCTEIKLPVVPAKQEIPG